MIFPYRVRHDVVLRALVAVCVLVATVIALSMSGAYASPIECGRFGCHETRLVAPAKHHARHRVHRPTRDANGNIADSRYCHPETAAGRITIACDLADKMQGFIRDVVARGFKGPVHCLSYSHSHVAHSLHFVGEACDFAQRGWGKTVRVMYHVRDLVAKWGLRDGCTFRDCGHIDSGRSVGRVRMVRR